MNEVPGARRAGLLCVRTRQVRVPDLVACAQDEDQFLRWLLGLDVVRSCVFLIVHYGVVAAISHSQFSRTRLPAQEILIFEATFARERDLSHDAKGEESLAIKPH